MHFHILGITRNMAIAGQSQIASGTVDTIKWVTSNWYLTMPINHRHFPYIVILLDGKSPWIDHGDNKQINPHIDFKCHESNDIDYFDWVVWKWNHAFSSKLWVTPVLVYSVPWFLLHWRHRAQGVDLCKGSNFLDLMLLDLHVFSVSSKCIIFSALWGNLNVFQL